MLEALIRWLKNQQLVVCLGKPRSFCKLVLAVNVSHTSQTQQRNSAQPLDRIPGEPKPIAHIQYILLAHGSERGEFNTSREKGASPHSLRQE